MALITGGSAVAQGLPDNFRKAGLVQKKSAQNNFVAPKSAAVILSGSCSEATLEQVEYAKSHLPHFHSSYLDTGLFRFPLQRCSHEYFNRENVIEKLI